MSFVSSFEKKITELKAKGLYRELLLEPQLSFVHNDYLCFSRHPRILERGRRACEEHGAGSRGSRLLGGHSSVFDQLETKIASFFGSPTALFFASGYMANMAVVRVLAEHADCILSDEKNHASLIDGIRLTSLPKVIVPHQDWSSLRGEILEKRLLIITETLFSMDGDVADLETLFELMKRTTSFVLLDEAHAAGIFPEDGRGFGSLFQRDWSRMAVVVTFGKAFGVSGAAVLCSGMLKELLINSARPFIYSTAPSPIIAAMVDEALDVVGDAKAQRQELWARARLVRKWLASTQPKISQLANQGGRFGECSPIIPFFVEGELRALRFSESMRRSGVGLRAIRYPTVPHGSERIRFSLHLGIDREKTEWAVSEVIRRWTEFSLQERIRE